MKKLTALLASSVLVLAAWAPSGIASAAQVVNLVFDGIPSANVSTPPASAAFTDWCKSICFPTTQFPVYDVNTGIMRGTAHVWGKSFAFSEGGSLCFSEFVAFALADGTLHVASGVNGTCGAPMDPMLKPPRDILGAQVVIAGGGDGVIVGGTGRYTGWTGTYTDRVFVGFGAPESGVGGIIYYDQLWFKVTAK